VDGTPAIATPAAATRGAQRHGDPAPGGQDAPEEGLSRADVFLLACAAGLSVAGLYYAQPLLDGIRGDLHLSSAAAGLVVTCSQLGYAVGLLLLVPLGDLLERRGLLTAMCVLSAGALGCTALATGEVSLFAASVAVGVFSCGAQLAVAFAATLAGSAKRGRVVGTVMSGLLCGILLARTAAGYLSVIGGWRLVFAVAAAMMLLLAVAVRARLPRSRAAAGPRYGGLVGSVFALLAQEPVLRLRALYGALGMAGFSVLWTALGLMLARPPYNYSSALIGLFGLVGASGALAAQFAGRFADRGRVRTATGLCVAVLAAAWLPIEGGGHSLTLLIVGTVVFDAAVQGLQITNQSQIYMLRPEIRSRLTAAYMTCYFLGGVVGSSLSTVVYARTGWTGTAVLGAALGIAACAVWTGMAIRGRLHARANEDR
jgi:predicted MFS family arabinose efflux permease